MNSPNTISDQVLDTAMYLHNGVVRLMRTLRTFRPEKGLSLAKFSILGFLYQDGATTATSLAAFLRIQPQSITRLLADLEQRRLVVRRPDKEDRRKSLIEITPNGSLLLMDEVHEQQAQLARVIDESLSVSEHKILRSAADLIDRLAGELEARVNKEKISKPAAVSDGSQQKE